MNVLVVGCGSIGKRHIRNLLALKIGEVAACDVNERKCSDTEKEFSIRVYRTLEEALNGFHCEAAFICTPPRYHVEQAMQVLETDMHCFIEKPLSDGLEGIDDLSRLVAIKKKVVMVGYTLRFSPFLEKIKELIQAGTIGAVLSLRASVGYYLPYWRPDEDYRKGYGSQKALGGGIVLDASHEIDYVRYLLGELTEVFAVCRKLSKLEIDTEDFAEIIFRSEKGAYAQIHLDYLQSNYRRNCEIIGDTGMLIWDINGRTLKHYGMKDKSYHCYYEGLNANVNDSYLNEIKHFFACVEGNAQPLVSLEDGKRLQEIFVIIKESSKSGKLLPL